MATCRCHREFQVPARLLKNPRKLGQFIATQLPTAMEWKPYDYGKQIDLFLPDQHLEFHEDGTPRKLGDRDMEFCPRCEHPIHLPGGMYINVEDFGSNIYNLHCPVCHKPIRVEAIRSVQVVDIKKSRHKKDHFQ